MNVRNLSRCCLLLLDVISIVSEMFVIFRIFVKFDRSGHAKFFTFWKITDWEIYRSRTLSINPTNVIACWSSCDHFRRWYGWFPTDLKIFDFSSNLTGPDLYFFKHIRYPAPINPMNVRNLSRCCLLLSDGISMVSKMFDVLRFFVKFDTSRHAKFFDFLGNHGTGDLSVKNALNQPYQCHRLLIIMWPF